MSPASSTDLAQWNGADITVRVVASATELADAWDRLDHGVSPFTSRGFLLALELSGSIDAPASRGASGWMPVYVLAEAAGQLVGGVPAFIKHHSYGEYIFDFAWANAAERAGLPYYPKLVVAAPGTPATGRRLLLARGLGAAARAKVIDALAQGVRAVAERARCSSIHWLFCTSDEQDALAERGFFPRASLQFHWHNRAYGSFDDFLAALRSRRRKQLRKERARARAGVEDLRWLSGADLDEDALADLDRWYRTTTDNHGGRAYMLPGFFSHAAAALPRSMQLLCAHKGGRRVGGALFFVGQAPDDAAGAGTGGALYGRYWGADLPIDCLHFEAAYYAGIERCIREGLPLFEAGAQGEHKLLRGFAPAATYSAHWIANGALRQAIERHCQVEAVAVARHMNELATLGPYHAGDEPDH